MALAEILAPSAQLGTWSEWDDRAAKHIQVARAEIARSRGITAVALFTLTLFRRRSSIHVEDAGHSSVRQSETSPQSCNAMASGQQRCRRLGRHHRPCNIIGSRPSEHYFRSVCLFVCLFVCAEFFQPSSIRFGSN